MVEIRSKKKIIEIWPNLLEIRLKKGKKGLILIKLIEKWPKTIKVYLNIDRKKAENWQKIDKNSQSCRNMAENSQNSTENLVKKCGELSKIDTIWLIEKIQTLSENNL